MHERMDQLIKASQVTSSSGKPYTLHIRPPRSEPDAPASNEDGDPVLGEGSDEAKDDGEVAPSLRKADVAGIREAKRTQELVAQARWMESLYCPCAGFMYNSLAGESNVLVSTRLHVAEGMHCLKSLEPSTYAAERPR
jgi:hypothetical protein